LIRRPPNEEEAMKRCRWLIFAAALAAGAFLVCFVHFQPKPETVQVLVARCSVPQGTFLREPAQFFEERAVAKELVPPEAITDMKGLRQKMVSRSIAAEGLVCQSDVCEADSFYVGEGPPGLRPITIRVHLDADLTQWILPGTSVDLIWERRLPDGKVVCTVLAEKVLVLAFNTGDLWPPGPRTCLITLAVTPPQAERMIRAAREGELHLRLRRQPGVGVKDQERARNAE
jgi:Flp pilus assembly protein CpaB